MKRRLTSRPRQNGMIAVVLVAVLVLGGTLYTFSSYNFTTVRVDRDRVTNDALARAKDALIAYAVSDTVRPGELPCPDVNDDGKVTLGEDIVGSACVSLIGRLPWSTLGLPDPRDDAGERLWYALSNDFHANGPVALNSDTAYLGANVSLTLAGTTPATNLVAIVFSPGTTLRRSDGVAQTRGCTVGIDCDANLKCTAVPASNTPKCNPVNFLDLAAGEDNSNLMNRIFVSAPRSDTFNDRVMPIFSDDIMRLVERRAARELAQRLRDHYDAWQAPPPVAGVAYAGFKGFYPWAAPLNDPSVVAAGVNGTTNGQLPLSAANVVWSNAPAPTFTLGGCVGGGTSQITCSGAVVCVLICLTSINARVEGIATAFVDPPNGTEVTTLGLLIGGAPTATWTLNPAARALDFSYSGGTILGIGVVTVQVRVPSASAWTTTSWLANNNWHQNAFYTVSPGYAIDGIDSCGGVGPACLTIANTAAPSNDKHAVVVMTGRALAAAAQPARPVVVPASLAQFLEGLNADGTLTQFESNARTATFNDTAAAVRP